MSSIETLLRRLHLDSWVSTFEDEELDVPLLRSMGPLLLDNLAELGLGAGEAQQIQQAVMLDVKPEAPLVGVAGVALARKQQDDEAPNGGRERVADQEHHPGMMEDIEAAETGHGWRGHEEQVGAPPDRSAPASEGSSVLVQRSGAVVHLSNEEFNRMAEESDDDDTPQGRARKRIKADINPNVYRMHMLGPSDEGAAPEAAALPISISMSMRVRVRMPMIVPCHVRRAHLSRRAFHCWFGLFTVSFVHRPRSRLLR